MTSSTPETSRPRRTRRRAYTALAVGALLVAGAVACSDDNSSASTDAGGGSGSDEMSISIAEPADGATVQVPFDVKLDTNVELGQPDTGLHHVHLYYDGATGENDYDKVYGDSFTVDRQLGDGEHTIEAVIANADHSVTDTRAEITVRVGDTGGSDSPGTEAPSNGPSGGGY